MDDTLFLRSKKLTDLKEMLIALEEHLAEIKQENKKKFDRLVKEEFDEFRKETSTSVEQSERK